MRKYYLILFITVTIFGYKNDDNSITYKPIGYFSTKYNLSVGAPRQGMLDTATHGIITLNNKYIGALKDLDKFEYIWVIYHFHQAEGMEDIVIPPDSDHEFGLFATRSPRRPNPIALSLIKLDTIIENKLFVSNIDAFDGTPVIDIKPFLPSVDYAVSIKNMEAELYLGHHDTDFINDSLANIFVKGSAIP